MSWLGLGLAVTAGRRRGLRGRGFDFGGGTLPAGATLSRGSAGTRFDASGRLVSEGPNVARFDHDPATLALRGLLIEPQRTNVLLQSGNVGAAAWSQNGSSPATGDLAPDGTTASVRVTVGTGFGPHQLCSMTVAAGSIWTLSVWRKPPTAQALALGFNGATNGGNNTGALSPADSVAWRRDAYALGAVADSGLYASVLATSGFNNVASPSPRTADVWGAQLEAGGASSYIPTIGASATRAADALTLDWAGLGIADGAVTIRYGFDDGTVQDVATTIAGGTTTVPTTLNRRWLRRAEII